MARFRPYKEQAHRALRDKFVFGTPRHGNRSDGKIHGRGTARTNRDTLAVLLKYSYENRLGSGNGLDGVTAEDAIAYLECRGQDVGQSTLNKDRLELQRVLRMKLPVIKSELDEGLEGRAYEHFQIDMIQHAQTPKHAMATKVARNGGLRAHELLTIMRFDERSLSGHREWDRACFTGRNDVVIYSVKGKGGLIRPVAFDSEIAEQLEQLRLSEPRRVVDREIEYTQYYGLGGGKRWSDSFSKASFRIFGRRFGGHGVRFTYAQDRMRALQLLGYTFEFALAIISQEMGHFRPEITQIYLR